MRKHVRFGLAIGGSLLALLVICAALFDRGPSNTTGDNVVPPPVAGGDGSQPPVAPIDVHSTDMIARNDTTRPSALSNVSSTARDWTTLLQTGDATSSDVPTTRPVEMKAAYTESPTSRPTGTKAGLTDSKTIGAKTHKVVAGETLYTIAASVYGDSKYYMRIEEANPAVNPNKLRIGTVLNVPALSEPLAAKTEASTGTMATTAVDSSKSYRVKSSDTLMSIARRLYGDGNAWEKIYGANRDVIGSNPARLQVGMVLRLPEPPTAAPTN